MAYEFSVCLTDAPNDEGPLPELPAMEDPALALWIDWDAGLDGYSGWNFAAAEEIRRQTAGASDELLPANQTYAKVAARADALRRFEQALDAITDEQLRARCTALAAGCRQALEREPERAVVIVY